MAAAARLDELLDQVVAQQERVVLTVDGRPAAVLLSPDDLASLEGTLAVLADEQSVQRLADSEEEVEAGRLESEVDLAVAMARRRNGDLQ